MTRPSAANRTTWEPLSRNESIDSDWTSERLLRKGPAISAAKMAKLYGPIQFQRVDMIEIRLPMDVSKV